MQITETVFGPKTYLAIKKSIAISQITDKDMYDQAGKKLGEYMAAHEIVPAGGWSVLYIKWDQAAQAAEIAIGFPIVGIDSTNDAEISIIDILAKNASMTTLMGPYSEVSPKLATTHPALMKHVGEKGFNTEGLEVFAVEEYATNPETESDPQKYVTNVYYLHN